MANLLKNTSIPNLKVNVEGSNAADSYHIWRNPMSYFNQKHHRGHGFANSKIPDL